jgi:hypothetical protein
VGLRTLVGSAACVGLVLLLSSAADVPGRVLGAVVVATLLLTIPLGVRRYRAERNLARLIWRSLTAR